MGKLYELQGKYLELFELAGDEETAEEFRQAIQDTKEGLDFELEEIAYNYAKVCKNLDYKKSNLEGQEKFLNEELERVRNKKKFIENNKKYLLNNLSNAMETAGVNKFKNEQFNIYHSKSISVEVNDLEKALEAGLATTEIKADKATIKKRLQSGEELNFAELKETRFLIIR